MSLIDRIIRQSHTRQEFDDLHLKLIYAAIAHGRQVLADNPVPDNFIGRKTQEPFPSEQAR